VKGRRLILGPVFQVQRSPFSSRPLQSRICLCVQATLRRVPSSRLQSWLRGAFPVWALPTRLIVKELDPEKEYAFQKEKEAYTRLQHLQGGIIPIYYGSVLVEHPGQPGLREAHLLELVNGTSLDKFPLERLNQGILKKEMEDAFAPFTEAKVVHGDPEARHFFYTNSGKLRIIDFGGAYVEEHRAALLNEGDIRNALEWLFPW
jgi:hypothetical protein